MAAVRLTNASSRKTENHAAAVPLHFMHYSFAPPYQIVTKHNGKLTTPAMAAGVAVHPWSVLRSPGCLTERAGSKKAVPIASLLVVAGPPGAGKTTVSGIVSARLSPSVLIRGDVFYRFLDQGAVTPWLPEAADQNRVVIRASGAAAAQYVRGGYEVVFDGVMGPWWLPTFFEATALDELHYAVLFPSVERCVQNVATREGHDNDERGTRYMHEQFQGAPIDARHLLTGPPASPEDTATELLWRYRHGLFAYGRRSN